jgi:hypothetical protein
VAPSGRSLGVSVGMNLGVAPSARCSEATDARRRGNWAPSGRMLFSLGERQVVDWGGKQRAWEHDREELGGGELRGRRRG